MFEIGIIYRYNIMSGFLNSPVGPKTIHFWAPVANWGFVLGGILDLGKPEEQISKNMVMTLLTYSTVFMRFAWQVQPRNYILFACHAANWCA
jgi:hypothetical protein